MPETAAQRLRRLRGRTPMREIASAVGVALSTISAYETGSRVPRDGVKRKLADYFGCPISELFFDEVQPATLPGEEMLPPCRATRTSLLDFDLMLHELEALIQLLGDTRDHHLDHGESMTKAQVELANTALWGAELGLTHLLNHYRGLVDKEIEERRKHE